MNLGSMPLSTLYQESFVNSESADLGGLSSPSDSLSTSSCLSVRYRNREMALENVLEGYSSRDSSAIRHCLKTDELACFASKLDKVIQPLFEDFGIAFAEQRRFLKGDVQERFHRRADVNSFPMKFFLGMPPIKRRLYHSGVQEKLEARRLTFKKANLPQIKATWSLLSQKVSEVHSVIRLWKQELGSERRSRLARGLQEIDPSLGIEGARRLLQELLKPFDNALEDNFLITVMLTDLLSLQLGERWRQIWRAHSDPRDDAGWWHCDAAFEALALLGPTLIKRLHSFDQWNDSVQGIGAILAADNSSSDEVHKRIISEIGAIFDAKPEIAEEVHMLVAGGEACIEWEF